MLEEDGVGEVLDTVDDGPGDDPGELSNTDESATDADGDEDGDEDGYYEPDSYEDDTGGEADPPPPAPSGPSETERLLQEQLASLSKLAASQQKQLQEMQRPKQAKPTGPDPVLMQAVKVLMSRDQTAIEALPPEARLKGNQWLRDANDLDITHRMDPAAAYRDRMAQFVEGHINHILQQRLGPMQGLVEQSRQRQIASYVEPHQKLLADASFKARVGEKLNVFDLNNMAPENLKAALDMAVMSVQHERASAGLGRKAQQLDTRDRQQQSNRQQRRGRNGRGKRGRGKPPEFTPNDLIGYAQRLEAYQQE